MLSYTHDGLNAVNDAFHEVEHFLNTHFDGLRLESFPLFVVQLSLAGQEFHCGLLGIAVEVAADGVDGGELFSV